MFIIKIDIKERKALIINFYNDIFKNNNYKDIKDYIKSYLKY